MGIHRHTGGLEKVRAKLAKIIGIHRHTGGLEIKKPMDSHALEIHRHTGGLEKIGFAVLNFSF